MRSAWVAMAGGMAGLLMSAAPAHATKCFYPERGVTGAPRNTFAGAQEAAIAAWQKSVTRNKGARYADWYYSGDRTISCRWNDRGTSFRCTASAVPCGE